MYICTSITKLISVELELFNLSNEVVTKNCYYFSAIWFTFLSFLASSKEFSTTALVIHSMLFWGEYAYCWFVLCQLHWSVNRSCYCLYETAYSYGIGSFSVYINKIKNTVGIYLIWILFKLRYSCFLMVILSVYQPSHCGPKSLLTLF